MVARGNVWAMANRHGGAFVLPGIHLRFQFARGTYRAGVVDGRLDRPSSSGRTEVEPVAGDGVADSAAPGLVCGTVIRRQQGVPLAYGFERGDLRNYLFWAR